MSLDYRPRKKIKLSEILDGRLEPYGIHEYADFDKSETNRCLTDGDSGLFVYGDEEGVTFKANGSCGFPVKILSAICDVFDADIFSNYDPQYWGFESEEAQEADNAYWVERNRQEREEREKFYWEIIANGKEAGYAPSKIDLRKLEIAKRLISENPDLQSPVKKDEFIDLVEKLSRRKTENDCIVTLDESDIPF
jgi:hypothetical protein